MPKNHRLEEYNKKPIIKSFIIFIVTIALLFSVISLVILVPKINSTFETLYSKNDTTTAKALYGELDQYLYDRELALHDIAANSLLTNVVLQDDKKNPAFIDYIQHVTLLGENPAITILDALGSILYEESDSGLNKATNKSKMQWAIPLLKSNKYSSLLKVENIKSPFFLLAVPILYGKSIEGVLIAKINASPNYIYSRENFSFIDTAVSYEKNGQLITSKINHIKSPHYKKLKIKNYDINFTYISDHFLKLEDKKDILLGFIYTIIFGGVIILILIFILGRKIIIKPFHDLAETQKAISLAVEGISLIDTKGRYIKLNKAYANTCGYSPEELIGKEWSITVYKDDLPMLNKAYEEMLEKDIVSREARGVKKDGSMFYKKVTMMSRYNDAEKQNIYIYHFIDKYDSKRFCSWY